CLQLPGLAVLNVEVVDDDEIALLRLRRQGHFEPQNANFLVQRRIEIADTGAVGLAAADEDRSAAIAVTGGAAAFLPAELLTGPGDIRALASGARSAATFFELPGDNAMQDVGAGLNGENLV